MFKESSPNKGIIATIGMLMMIATIIVAVSVISSNKAEAAPSNNGVGNNNTNTNGNVTNNNSTTNATKVSRNETTIEGLNDNSNNSSTISPDSQFIKAREQYLRSWEQSNFSSEFATFVIPNSVNGYGIYDEHRSNIFKPGEPIVLYVEPIGFTHKKLTDESGNALYNVKLIPSVIISSKIDNKSASIDFPPFAFTSHRKNTEAELTITVTQNTPIPEGEYKILYTIKDAQSNKSFDIIKKVVISNREVI
jgi:hypothetical protein